MPLHTYPLSDEVKIRLLEELVEAQAKMLAYYRTGGRPPLGAIDMVSSRKAYLQRDAEVRADA